MEVLILFLRLQKEPSMIRLLRVYLHQVRFCCSAGPMGWVLDTPEHLQSPVEMRENSTKCLVWTNHDDQEEILVFPIFCFIQSQKIYLNDIGRSHALKICPPNFPPASVKQSHINFNAMDHLLSPVTGEDLVCSGNKSFQQWNPSSSHALNVFSKAMTLRQKKKKKGKKGRLRVCIIMSDRTYRLLLQRLK